MLIDTNATEEAERHLTRAAASINDPETDLANAIDTFRGDLALARGDGPAALVFYAASLRLATRRGDGIQTVNDAASVAQTLAFAGRPDAALEAAGAAAALVADSGFTDPLHALDDVIAAARIAVGPGAGQLIARGRHLPSGELVARILALAETPSPPRSTARSESKGPLMS